MKRMIGLFWLAALGIVLGPGPGLAAPWDRLLVFGRVEADPNKEYRVTEENGPWMILACSFSGENAHQQAHDLVLELRRRYKLPAYTYEKTFKFEEDAAGRGLGSQGRRVRMRYRRGPAVREIAVLVGDYPTINDPKAQATLKRLRYYRPKCLELTPSKPIALNLAAWRFFTKFTSPEKEREGPLRKAFLTTNPLLPKEFFVPQGLDEFLVELNEGRKYSLLDCPGKYSVQVAHFTGQVVMDQAKIREVEQGRRQLESKLAEAAEKAEKLTEALRMKGYEAYVFHDRYASIVTVGSFDSVGTPRADGRIEIDPQILAIMETFGVDKSKLGPARNPAELLKPKELEGIPFDLQPVPVKVPKRSLSARYVRNSP